MTVSFMEGSGLNGNGNALATKVAAAAVKTTGNGGATVRAVSSGIQSELVDLVPVARDECGLASRAIRGVALGVVHIAGVHIVQPGFERDVASAYQRGTGRCGHIEHFVVGVKG